MKDPTDTLSLHEALGLLHDGKIKPFSVCDVLADKIFDLMQDNTVRAENCLQFVADTYKYTDCNVVKRAIKHCFLYRIGRSIFAAEDHARLLRILPTVLHNILMRRMLATIQPGTLQGDPRFFNTYFNSGRRGERSGVQGRGIVV